MTNNTSCQTVKVQEMLSYLLYMVGDGYHYGWVEGVPIQTILEKYPELLKTFLDIMNYDSSHTSENEEKDLSGYIKKNSISVGCGIGSEFSNASDWEGDFGELDEDEL